MTAQELSEAEATPVWAVVGTDDDEGALYGVFATPELAQEHADEFDDGTVTVQREPVIGSEAPGVSVPTNNEEAEVLNLLKYAAGVDHPTFGQGFFFTQAAVNSLISDVRRLPVSGDNDALVSDLKFARTTLDATDLGTYWLGLIDRAISALSASQPREAAPSDTDEEALEQATLYGYQAVWDDGEFDADPAKNAWMWGRVQIAVKAAVERAARTSRPVQVEVTDDMVERMARSLFAQTAEGRSGFTWPINGDWGRERDMEHARSVLMRALGPAALGGGDHAE